MFFRCSSTEVYRFLETAIDEAVNSNVKVDDMVILPPCDEDQGIPSEEDGDDEILDNMSIPDEVPGMAELHLSADLSEVPESGFQGDRWRKRDIVCMGPPEPVEVSESLMQHHGKSPFAIFSFFSVWKWYHLLLSKRTCMHHATKMKPISA